MSEPFWEKAYQVPDADTFGRPSAEIIRLAEQLPPGSSVLDLGCGEGRNALFLAAQHLAVDACDISSAGIAKLKAHAAKEDLAIDAWVADLAAFEFSRDYDAIIAHGVLHLLPRADWARLIAAMRQHTKPGGVNIVAVFTDDIPPPDDLAPFMRGLFKKGELATHYADWRLDINESYVLEDEHPGDIRHRHPIDKVVAWEKTATI